MKYYIRKVRLLSYDTKNSVIYIDEPRSKSAGTNRSKADRSCVSMMSDVDVQYMRSIIKPMYSSTTT
jgi:RecA-family ATPase